MAISPGDYISDQFTLRNPTTKEASNADDLPIGTLIRQGDDTAVAVVITNLAIGVYKWGTVVPDNWGEGEMVAIRIAAIVDKKSDNAVVWSGSLSTVNTVSIIAAMEAAIEAMEINLDGVVISPTRTVFGPCEQPTPAQPLLAPCERRVVQGTLTSQC